MGEFGGFGGFLLGGRILWWRKRWVVCLRLSYDILFHHRLRMEEPITPLLQDTSETAIARPGEEFNNRNS